MCHLTLLIDSCQFPKVRQYRFSNTELGRKYPEPTFDGIKIKKKKEIIVLPLNLIFLKHYFILFGGINDVIVIILNYY